MPFSLKDDTNHDGHSEDEITSFDLVRKYMRVVDSEIVNNDSQMDNIKHLQGAVRLIRRAIAEMNPVLNLLNVFCILYLGLEANEMLEDELYNDYKAVYEQTALSEVRAGTFDYVTIGTFQLKKEIRVVNISELNKISPVLYSSNIESLSANTKIFRDIANEIAKPLRRNDSALAYLPTQFITEFIKSNGYAGVAYTSTMRTEGINVAVFDESIFECVAVHTVEINNISYSYEKITYGQQK